MIVERAEHPDWLSNAYLFAEDGRGVLVDNNGVGGPLYEIVERQGIELTHILLTHHHMDHVVAVAELKKRFGVPVVAHEKVAAELEEDVVDQTLDDGERLEAGGLQIEALLTEGHAPGHLSYFFNGTDCTTADVLFKGTVGGTRAPGATGFADLRASIMDRLMNLPPETRIHPGHREPTTVKDEWESNPFIRIWRGRDREGDELCRVGDQEATLVLWAPDYDGGNKAWVRFPDGEDAIVGGSQVTR
ncbi:MAG TPA: MBL fold metallo-hydrolase [Thermoleophilaceae bacterium]|nr:MBL fold metallo-hydrolase [Thermoleophilaceae bacterium]